MDVVKGEMVEKELDTTIERRCLRKDPDEERELWKASVARHNALRREELRMAWCEYHLNRVASLRATLEALIDHHASQAEKYRDQPKGAA